jgi:hypothetical protein
MGRHLERGAGQGIPLSALPSTCVPGRYDALLGEVWSNDRIKMLSRNFPAAHRIFRSVSSGLAGNL